MREHASPKGRAFRIFCGGLGIQWLDYPRFYGMEGHWARRFPAVMATRLLPMDCLIGIPAGMPSH